MLANLSANFCRRATPRRPGRLSARLTHPGRCGSAQCGPAWPPGAPGGGPPGPGAGGPGPAAPGAGGARQGRASSQLAEARLRELARPSPAPRRPRARPRPGSGRPRPSDLMAACAISWRQPKRGPSSRSLSGALFWTPLLAGRAATRPAPGRRGSAGAPCLAGGWQAHAGKLTPGEPHPGCERRQTRTSRAPAQAGALWAGDERAAGAGPGAAPGGSHPRRRRWPPPPPLSSRASGKLGGAPLSSARARERGPCPPFWGAPLPPRASPLPSALPPL